MPFGEPEKHATSCGTLGSKDAPGSVEMLRISGSKF